MIVSGLVVAQTLPRPGSDDPARRLLDDERSRQRERRLTRETPEPEVAPESDDGRPPIEYPEIEPVFPITEIIVKGNTLLSDDDIEAIIKPFRGIPLGINRINLLMRRLTARYLELGYFTTRCYLGEQNLADGVLVIQVFEGRIERLQYNGKAPPPGVSLAFPTREGEIAHLGDIEQGIEQLNRLRRNKATLSVEPGEKPGGSIIHINNPQTSGHYYTIGIDNAGQESTGQHRLRLAADLEDILGFQENMALAYVGTRDTNALLFSAGIPFGYQTFSYTLSYSDYVNPLGGYALLFGDTVWHNLGWNLLLKRTQQGRSSIDVSIGRRENRRFINDAPLTPQKQTSLRVAVNRYQIESWGTWLGELSWTRGLDLFNSDRDLPNLPREAPTTGFEKTNAMLDVNVSLSEDWAWRTQASAQWSRTGLFGSEQFVAGGSGSVRGFDEGFSAGDRGLLFRNDLTWHGVHALDSYQIRVLPYAFLDAARVRQWAAERGETLVGAGIGIRIGGRGINGDLSIGKPVAYPSDRPDSGGSKLAFSLSYQY